MTEQGEQRICIKFCINYLDDSEGRSYGRLVIGSFNITTCLLMCHVSCRVFWQNIKSPRWLGPLQPRFGTLQFLAFSKAKITFEREEISHHQWDSGKYDQTADGDWENCVRSHGAYFERGLRCHCPMYSVLASSSINVSIFHITWLDTFWTDLVFLKALCVGYPPFNLTICIRKINLEEPSLVRWLILCVTTYMETDFALSITFYLAPSTTL